MRRSFAFVATSFAWSLISYAQDWSAEKVIPEIKVVGKPTAEESALAQEVRKDLVSQLDYWKAKGLPAPAALEGIYYVPSLADLTLNELIQSMNPEIPDVKAHILAQKKAFDESGVAKFIDEAGEMLAKAKDGEKYRALAARAKESFFDQYAKIRYGVAVPRIAETVQSTNRYDQSAFSVSSEFSDNAFMGRFPKLDVAEIFPPAGKESVFKTRDFASLADFKKLTTLMTDPSKFSRRIVILPRKGQRPGDLAVSTLKDKSVSRHELGHLQNQEAGQIHRLVDEVYADYMAAAPVGNPKIGEFFVRANAEMGRRLREGDIMNDFREARALERIAAKGVLRDMSHFASLDTIDRHRMLSDDYSGGAPLRNFLWRLRQNPKVSVENLDRVALSALRDFGALPEVMSGYSSAAVAMRGQLLGLMSMLKEKVRSDKLLQREFEKRGLKGRDLKAELDELRKQAWLAIDEEDPKKSVQMYEDQQAKSNELRRLRGEAEEHAEALAARLDRREESRARMAQKWKAGWLGADRPAITSDYVIPEFLRSFYRAAAAQDPVLAEEVVKQAGQNMNGTPMLITLSDGSKELVFLKTPWARMNPVARAKLRSSLEKLRKLKPQIQAAKKQHADDFMKQVEVTSPLKGQYLNALDGIQEFERTGATLDLFLPHRNQRVAAKLGTVAVNTLAKGFSQKAKAATTATESCVQDLARLLENLR